MEMDLQEAAARVSVLGDEKPEQEGNIAAFKGKVSRDLDLSEAGQYVESEKESPLLLTIGSAEHEMAKLTRENHRQFGDELLHNGLENKSSESTSEVRQFPCKVREQCESARRWTRKPQSFGAVTFKSLHFWIKLICWNFDMHIFKRLINCFFFVHLQERTFSILETRRVKTLYKVTFLADENCQEDTKNKWSVRFYCF